MAGLSGKTAGFMKTNQTEQAGETGPETTPKIQKKVPSSLQLFLESYGIPWTAALRVAAGMAVLMCAGLVALAVAGRRTFAAARAEEASMQLRQASTATEVTEVMNRYPSSQFLPLAMLKLAHVSYAEENYNLAYTIYEQFSNKYPDHPLALTSEMGKIFCIEAQGQTERALQAFIDFSLRHPDSFLAAEAVFGQGRCLEQLDRKEEARQVYEEFLAAQPRSVWVDRAERALNDVKIELQRKNGTL